VTLGWHPVRRRFIFRHSAAGGHQDSSNEGKGS
jgi:hypothetical protein